MESHSVGRDLGTSTVCHHLAAFCLPFNRANSMNLSLSMRRLHVHLLSVQEGSLVPLQFLSEDKVQVSGVVLASWFIQAMHVHGLRFAFQPNG